MNRRHSQSANAPPVKSLSDGASAWGVLHDGDVNGEYATKEAAFEAAVSAASLAMR